MWHMTKLRITFILRLLAVKEKEKFSDNLISMLKRFEVFFHRNIFLFENGTHKNSRRAFDDST